MNGNNHETGRLLPGQFCRPVIHNRNTLTSPMGRERWKSGVDEVLQKREFKRAWILRVTTARTYASINCALSSLLLSLFCSDVTFVQVVLIVLRDFRIFTTTLLWLTGEFSQSVFAIRKNQITKWKFAVWPVSFSSDPPLQSASFVICLSDSSICNKNRLMQQTSHVHTCASFFQESLQDENNNNSRSVAEE